MPGKKTSQSALGSSAAVEDYLERILELINSKGYARVVDIAAALKISQASVTNMIQRLDTEGLLKYEKYRGLILTAAGKNLARKIAHRHKLLTDFLTLLGLDQRIIYHDVEGMEHHVSPPTLRAIEALTAQLRAIWPAVSTWLIFHAAEHSTTARWVELARKHLSGYDPKAMIAAGTNRRGWTGLAVPSKPICA